MPARPPKLQHRVDTFRRGQRVELRLFNFIISAMTVLCLVVLAKAWVIVPEYRASIVTCGIVLPLATIGLLTKTRDIQNRALFAAVPSYAALLIALGMVIHKG